MKLTLIIGLVFLVFQQSLPYKPKEEFEIKLQYEFKQRPITNNSNTSVHLSETPRERDRRTSTSMLPYVGLNLRILKLNPEDVKMKVIDSQAKTVHNKKVQLDEIVFLNLGFTDDMKDRVTAHEYTVYFVSADKRDLNRILITINEDGTFLVNEEKRGKF